MDYNSSYSRYQELSEKAIANELNYYNQIPEPLQSAIKYSINAGGKRLRPVLLLAACEMMGEKIEKAFPFATAIELIHTYSLIHDDLPCMDNDDYRRGLPCNHKVFGEATALLAGDGLLNMAYEIMLRHIINNNSQNIIKAAAEIAEAAGSLGMAAGQSLDLYNENNTSAGEKELLYIHKHKTGCLISASLTAGAYIANANSKKINIIKQIGEELGVLFQITDDILDVTGDFKSMGKKINKDADRGKLTYIKLYGLENSKELASNSAQKITDKLKQLNCDTKFFEQITLKLLNRTQ